MSGVNRMIYWRALYGHTLIHSVFSPFSPPFPLFPSVWPDRLIKNREKRLIFLDQNVFVTSHNGVESVGNSKAVE